MKSSKSGPKPNSLDNTISSERSRMITAWLSIVLFITLWLSSSFLYSAGIVLLIWSLYFAFKAIKTASRRPRNVCIAIVLVISGSAILPTTTSQPSETAQISVSEDSHIEEAEQAKIEAKELEAERIAKDKEIAEDKERDRKEKLAQQVNLTGDTYQVTSITDGDTIKVKINGVIETIRFIGMDTPETKDPRKPVQCFGREATSKMQSYVQSKKVRLESDPSQGDRDKYGRLLRYVYTEDGSNVAYEMIRNGYAHEYTYNTPYKYQIQFKKAENTARKNNAGLWSPTTCNGITNQQHTQPKPAAKPAAPSATYYKNCTAARAAGAAPVHIGQPGYGSHLDRDGDGIGCE